MLYLVLKKSSDDYNRGLWSLGGVRMPAGPLVGYVHSGSICGSNPKAHGTIECIQRAGPVRRLDFLVTFVSRQK